MAVLIGVTTALIGCYVVLRGLAFIGASIAHASFGGVSLGLLLGINPVLSAVVFCLATGLGISIVSENKNVKEDTAIGIFFAATMAFGIFLIGFLEDYVTDIFGYLFGDILAVSQTDIVVTVLLTAFVLLSILLLYKEFLLISFDPEAAEAQGFPVKWIYRFLVALVALTVSISLKVVGIILVSALLVIPAATAHLIAKNFSQMQWMAVIVSLISSMVGLIVSYIFDTPSGATIVLVSTAIFFMVWGWKNTMGAQNAN